MRNFRLIFMLVLCLAWQTSAEAKHPLNGKFNGPYDNYEPIRALGVAPQAAWCNYLGSLAEDSFWHRLAGMQGLKPVSEQKSLDVHLLFFTSTFGRAPSNAERSWIKHMVTVAWRVDMTMPPSLLKQQILRWCYSDFPDPVFPDLDVSTPTAPVPAPAQKRGK